MSKKIIIILISALVCIGAVTTYFVLSKDGKKEEINVIDKQKKVKESEKDKKKDTDKKETEKNKKKETEKDKKKETEKNSSKEPEKSIDEKEEKVKVIFDTDGGNKIDGVEVKKNSTLKLPTPTKNGNKFLGWYLDSKKIDDSYKFSKDTTIKASWEPYKYKCETGWTLSGTNCVKLANPTYSCSPDKELKGDSSTCVTINYSSRIESNRKCKTKTVIVDNNGHTESIQGELFMAGTSFCYYGVVKDSSEQANSTTCQNRGHSWNNQNSKCYYLRDQDTENSCSNSNYAYISNPNEYDGVNGLNGGCFPKYKKERKCPSGYELIKVNRTNRIVTYICRNTKAAIMY